MDGTPFDFTDWSKGQPQNISGNYCGAVSVLNGQWSADDCYQIKPFVCLTTIQLINNTTKVTPATVATTTTNIPKTCLWGWTYYGTTGHCYKAFQAYIWVMAEDSCKTDGAHLASIHSQNEALFVADLADHSLSTNCDNNVAQVGFHTEDNNTHWRWTDGTPFDFPNWAPGNPDRPAAENCGAIYLSSKCGYKTGQFNNIGCGYQASQFICKMKPFQ